jgi:hypothetical protein
METNEMTDKANSKKRKSPFFKETEASPKEEKTETKKNGTSTLNLFKAEKKEDKDSGHSIKHPPSRLSYGPGSISSATSYYTYPGSETTSKKKDEKKTEDEEDESPGGKRNKRTDSFLLDSSRRKEDVEKRKSEKEKKGFLSAKEALKKQQKKEKTGEKGKK